MINLKLLKENLEFVWRLPYLSNLLLILCFVFVIGGTLALTSNTLLTSDTASKQEFTLNKNFNYLYYDKTDVKAIYYDNSDGIPESVIYDEHTDIRIILDDIKSSKIPAYVITLIKKEIKD